MPPTPSCTPKIENAPLNFNLHPLTAKGGAFVSK